MNRRQFLLGVSSAAIAAAVPERSGPIVGWDLASGPDRASLAIFEPNPGADSWVWKTLYENQGSAPLYVAGENGFKPWFGPVDFPEFSIDDATAYLSRLIEESRQK